MKINITRGACTGGAGVTYATPALSSGVAGVAYGALSIVGKNRNRRIKTVISFKNNNILNKMSPLHGLSQPLTINIRNCLSTDTTSQAPERGIT